MSNPIINRYIVILGTLIFFVLAYIIYKYIKSIRDNKKAQENKINIKSKFFSGNEKKSAIERRMSEIEEEKREKFLNIPKIDFHYADKEQIESIYDNYFPGLRAKRIFKESIGDKDSSITTGISNFFQARFNLGWKKTHKVAGEYEPPELKLPKMFHLYQDETIKNRQVTLCLEEVEIEFTQIDAFKEEMEKLDNEYDFQIEEKISESHEEKLRERAAQRTLKKLENARGSVLIEGNFKIESDGDFFKYTFSHPVNKYLLDKSQAVSIIVRVPQKSIYDSVRGSIENNIGSLFTIRIYGDIFLPIDPQNKRWQIELKPLAVYC